MTFIIYYPNRYLNMSKYARRAKVFFKQTIVLYKSALKPLVIETVFLIKAGEVIYKFLKLTVPLVKLLLMILFSLISCG